MAFWQAVYGITGIAQSLIINLLDQRGANQPLTNFSNISQFCGMAFCGLISLKFNLITFYKEVKQITLWKYFLMVTMFDLIGNTACMLGIYWLGSGLVILY